MKIAMIGQKGIPALQGGIEQHVEKLSLHLAGLGHSVYVYTRPWYTEKSKTIYKGVHLINLPSVHTKHLDAISHTLFASMHALFQDYDIIHYHGVGPSLLSWIPRAFKPKVKVVATFHCRDSKHQKWGWFARLMLHLGEWMNCQAPHQTITVSKTLQDYCRKEYHKETIYLPNGIDQGSKVKSQKSKVMERFGLERGRYILIVSRLVRHKGIHCLIQAFKNFPQKLQATSYKLVIVGDSVFTDDYVKLLKEMAGDDKNIIFTGSQQNENLEVLFRNAYLFVFPSEAEGLATVILEAMVYGVPVLASDIPENMELVKDYGWHFKNKDVDDLARKLQYLIEHPEILKLKTKEAQEFVLKSYNWPILARQIEKIYAGVLVKKEMAAWIKTKAISTANLLRQ